MDPVLLIERLDRLEKFMARTKRILTFNEAVIIRAYPKYL